MNINLMRFLLVLLPLAGCGQQNVIDVNAQPPKALQTAIHSIVAQQLGIPVGKVHEDASFASLGADDLDLVEIVMAVEDAHGIAMRDDALVAAAGVTQADRLVHHLTIKSFVSVAASSEKQATASTALDGNKEKKIPVGAYSEIAKMTLSDDQTILFVPSLAAILANHESQKGRLLTEQEVIDIRDRSATMVVPESVAKKMDKSRGYKDLNPDKCWLGWQELRKHTEDEKTEQSHAVDADKPHR